MTAWIRILLAGAAALIIVSACSAGQAVDDFCSTSNSCACDDRGECCVNESFDCGEGAPCCSGLTCSPDGQCVAEVGAGGGTGGGSGGGSGGGVVGGSGGDAGPSNFSLTIQTVGASTGDVNFGGTICIPGAVCNAVVTPGSPLVLDAFPSSVSGLRNFSGDCTPTGDHTCRVVFDGGQQQVTATFVPLNTVFVSKEIFPTDAGLNARLFVRDAGAADDFCARAAADAGLAGTFKAWFSTNSQTAVQRLQSGANPNPRGFMTRRKELFADSLQKLTTIPGSKGVWRWQVGEVLRPIFYDQHDNKLRNDSANQNVREVMTGTRETGAKHVQCYDNSDAGMITQGNLTATAVDWTNGGVTSCDTPMLLYCFQTDFTGTPRIVAPPGKLAFVTTRQTPSLGSSAAFDRFCEDEALDAGYVDGGFKAWVSAGGASLETRFLDAGYFVRPDGIALGTMDDIGNARFVTLNVTPKREYLWAFAWTGATSFISTSARSCANWSVTTVGDAGQVGFAGDLKLLISNDSRPCNTALSLYCFQTK